MDLSNAGRVWNRACMENGGNDPLEGDRALADLIHFDSLVANGGLSHGFDACSERETQSAIEGFRYFGLTRIADFLVVASEYSEAKQEGLSEQYWELSENIFATFEVAYNADTTVFAPPD